MVNHVCTLLNPVTYEFMNVIGLVDVNTSRFFSGEKKPIVFQFLKCVDMYNGYVDVLGVLNQVLGVSCIGT